MYARRGQDADFSTDASDSLSTPDSPLYRGRRGMSSWIVPCRQCAWDSNS
jgi:hypothetical protein